MERNHNRKGNGETESGYAVVDRARKKERKKESRELRLAREERLREGRIRRKGEEEGENRVEKGPRRRYPSRTAG